VVAVTQQALGVIRNALYGVFEELLLGAVETKIVESEDDCIACMEHLVDK